MRGLLLIWLIFKLTSANENASETFKKFDNFYLLTSANLFTYEMSVQTCNKYGMRLISLKDDFTELMRDFNGTFFVQRLIFNEKFNNSHIEGFVFPFLIHQLGIIVVLTNRNSTNHQVVCVNSGEIKYASGDDDIFFVYLIIIACSLTLIVIIVGIILHLLKCIHCTTQSAETITIGDVIS